jgi:predicted protein tyrosine phosphatase
MPINILFVCSQGRHRSRTAAAVAAECLPGAHTRYAGVLADADVPVTEDDVRWAELIVCMENYHRNRLRRRYRGLSGKIRVWHLPDEFERGEPALVSRIRERLIALG